MEYLLSRYTFFGNPFYNLNAGRDHRDYENTQRLRTAMRQFQQSEGIMRYISEGQSLPRKFTDQQINGVRYGLPVVGLFVIIVLTQLGRFVGDIYCAQSSIYLKGIFAVVSGIFFNKIAMDIKNDNEVSYWTSNYPNLPADIQKAISHGDSRYTTRWQ